jgi:hypothetical protein
VQISKYAYLNTAVKTSVLDIILRIVLLTTLVSGAMAQGGG